MKNLYNIMLKWIESRTVGELKVMIALTVAIGVAFNFYVIISVCA